MADDDPLRMTMPELLAFVAELEAKYRTYALPTLEPGVTKPQQHVRVVELARLRASLQECVAHLDRLLSDWDREQARQRHGTGE